VDRRWIVSEMVAAADARVTTAQVTTAAVAGGGVVQVVTVPYPVRSRLLDSAAHRGLNMNELDEALRQIVSDNIEALKAELDPALPAVLVGHFSVSGATWGSERSVMLGRDVVVQKSALADPAFDYVALGHIHKYQNLTAGLPGTPPVVYSGSLERIDFGELLC